ncbi:hypothetical protein A9Q88_04945 [Gammaproteobacteria bacterium 50_400_T64]|nr:hypothetical protein A9Q88_04945 [Gammaproteobacteria bacterium 50_400_T64]
MTIVLIQKWGFKLQQLGKVLKARGYAANFKLAKSTISDGSFHLAFCRIKKIISSACNSGYQ